TWVPQYGPTRFPLAVRAGSCVFANSRRFFQRSPSVRLTNFPNFLAAIRSGRFTRGFDDLHRREAKFARRTVRGFPENGINKIEGGCSTRIDLLLRERWEIRAAPGKISQRHRPVPEFKLQNSFGSKHADFIMALTQGCRASACEIDQRAVVQRDGQGVVD